MNQRRNTGRKCKHVDPYTTTRDIKISLDAESDVRIDLLTTAYERTFGARPSRSFLIRQALRAAVSRHGMKVLALAASEES